jgi:hypothetical protein
MPVRPAAHIRVDGFPAVDALLSLDLICARQRLRTPPVPGDSEDRIREGMLLYEVPLLLVEQGA